jgi:hypothetical protein
MKKYAVLAALAAFVCLMAFLNPGKAPDARADGGGGQNKFFFSVLSQDKKTGYQIVLSGCGKFSNKHVEGGGGFTEWNPVGKPPFPIISHGTYKAKKFLSFKETKGSPYGEQISGVLEMEVELSPVAKNKVKGTMKVVCNVPAGTLFTGEDEGVTLTVSGGGTFAPTGTGVTLFNPGPGESD